jgi:hypothetical protein
MLINGVTEEWAGIACQCGFQYESRRSFYHWEAELVALSNVQDMKYCPVQVQPLQWDPAPGGQIKAFEAEIVCYFYWNLNLNKGHQVQSKGIWRWCKTLGINGIMEFDHRPDL